MKLSEAVQVALQTRDHRMIGRVVEQLREKCGHTYAMTYDLFRTVDPRMTPEAFEDLMQEIDEEV